MVVSVTVELEVLGGPLDGYRVLLDPESAKHDFVVVESQFGRWIMPILHTDERLYALWNQGREYVEG